MPTATTPPTTPTRRSALFGVAAITVATAARSPALASVNPDAALIAACNRIVAIEAEQDAIYAVPEERQDQRALNALYAEAAVVMRRIYDAPETETLAGLDAMARAARALAPKGRPMGVVGNDRVPDHPVPRHKQARLRGEGREGTISLRADQGDVRRTQKAGASVWAGASMTCRPSRPTLLDVTVLQLRCFVARSRFHWACFMAGTTPTEVLRLLRLAKLTGAGV